MSVAELLQRELEKQAAEEEKRLQSARRANARFSQIAEERQGFQHTHNLTDEAYNSLMDDPNKARKFISLTKQNA